MVSIPDSLTWSLINQNNSFMVKRNGRTRRTGSIRFSKEAGNLTSLSTFKYSGLANTRTIDVVTTPATTKASTDPKKGTSYPTLVLQTSTPSKASKPSKAVSKTLLRKNFRNTLAKSAKDATSSYYRRDLAGAAKAKFAVLYNAKMVAKGAR